VDFETQVKALHAKIEELELGVAGKHLECQDLQDQLAAAMELLDEVPTNAVEGVDAPDQQLLVDLANAQERIKHVEQAHASTKEDLSRARSRIALVESREAKDLQELAKIREEIAELRRVKVSLDEALTAHVARPPFFGHSEIVNRDAVRKLL
jgi:chromosome segregation ATPase